MLHDLLIGREQMAHAETRVRKALDQRSPGDGASQIVQTYRLMSESERQALVSVLATRVAISNFVLRSNGSGKEFRDGP